MATKRVHVIDAAHKAPGRVASQAVRLLLGKQKPGYAPHLDQGDAVKILHARQVCFTGRKLVQKDYYHHTLHPGGLKRETLKRVFEKNPAKVLEKAIWGMLPKNSHRKHIAMRLTIEL